MPNEHNSSHGEALNFTILHTQDSGLSYLFGRRGASGRPAPTFCYPDPTSIGASPKYLVVTFCTRHVSKFLITSRFLFPFCEGVSRAYLCLTTYLFVVLFPSINPLARECEASRSRWPGSFDPA